MLENLENSAVAQDWKRSVFIPMPKKGNPKEFSNYHTIALISHTSKMMLKILQARLQRYMSCELPDVQTGLLFFFLFLFLLYFTLRYCIGFAIVNKAEVDVFLKLSCFFSDPSDVGNLISGSSAFSKTRLNIWKFHGSCIAEALLGEFGALLY